MQEPGKIAGELKLRFKLRAARLKVQRAGWAVRQSLHAIPVYVDQAQQMLLTTAKLPWQALSRESLLRQSPFEFLVATHPTVRSQVLDNCAADWHEQEEKLQAGRPTCQTCT